jgi:hypothetical protein
MSAAAGHRGLHENGRIGLKAWAKVNSFVSTDVRGRRIWKGSGNMNGQDQPLSFPQYVVCWDLQPACGINIDYKWLNINRNLKFIKIVPILHNLR